jgi:hypothetical protein
VPKESHFKVSIAWNLNYNVDKPTSINYYSLPFCYVPRYTISRCITKAIKKVRMTYNLVKKKEQTRRQFSCCSCSTCTCIQQFFLDRTIMTRISIRGRKLNIQEIVTIIHELSVELTATHKMCFSIFFQYNINTHTQPN